MLKTNEKLLPHFDKIEARMTNLNLAILTIQGLSTAYQIGAAYFLKLKNYLACDGELEKCSWESLWYNHLYGLLFEYLRGLPNAEEDLNTLYRAYTLKDKYGMENKKAIKIPPHDA
jgi:5-methylcytosine-specific restriction protein B